jgi:hypothetical protein
LLPDVVFNLVKAYAGRLGLNRQTSAKSRKKGGSACLAISWHLNASSR